MRRIVLETDDPIELVTELNLLKERPRLAASIRRRGRMTAREYIWEKVIGQLLLKVGFAAVQQAVRLPTNERSETKVVRRPTRKAVLPDG